MPDFLTALLWALTLLVSLAGWGRLAQRLAAIRVPTLSDWLDTPSLGLATLTVLGGILNVLQLATREGLLAVGIAGIVPLLPDLNRRRLKNRPSVKTASSPVSLRLFFAFVLLLLFLRLASSIVLSAPDTPGVTLNPHDDMHSYLVSVARMLQTGTLGLDPFNDRLMVSSLGAQNFLNALGIAPLSWDSIHLADDGVALVALACSAAAVGRRVGLAPMWTLLLALTPLVVDWGVANTSANITAAALLLALASSILTPRSIISAAVLLAAVCAVKSTMIPAAAVVMAVATVASVLSRRSWAPLGIAGLAFLLDLPWMIWQYRSSGTLLYPLLGHGFHIREAAPSVAILFTPELLEHTLLPVVLLAVSAIALRVLRRTSVAAPLGVAVGLLLAWVVAWPVFTYSTQFTDIGRYVLPIAVPAVIFFLASAGVAARHFQRDAVAVAAFVLFFLVTSLDWYRVYTRDVPHSLYASVTYASRPWGAEAAQLHEMQQAIPAGERVLVYLTTPALLDFERNPIDVVDWPGETSPPPGIPIDAGSDAIATYLLSLHIRYVAYSYAAHANFHPQAYGYLLEPKAGPAFNRFAAHAFAFQNALMQLARTRKVVHQDSQNVVIDLGM